METGRTQDLSFVNACWRGVQIFSQEIERKELLSFDDAGDLMNIPAFRVEQLRARGALYAYVFDPKAVTEICAAKKGDPAEIKPLLDFMAQGNNKGIPAWQIDAQGNVRPETLRARKAYALFAAAGAGYGYPAEVDDKHLYYFFKRAGDATRVLPLEADVPAHPGYWTVARLRDAWHWQEAPKYGYS